MMLRVRLCAIIESANDVAMKMTATTPVALPSTVGVPIEPNTA
jgi:hypothetical protein